ncbi:nitroreductase [Mycolicibacterium baixiangningiae]|uniref:nitroreductase n=1 Tax=Mycolicibacterium baixiangningiae TaxID=2761578 RepID=UPI0018672F2E|nr:nitroreductase [Mycolicibacterium baixiangningiae]
MTDSSTAFTDVVRSRRSARRFLPDPMSTADIRNVLEDAQTAPSNSNTQPWAVHVVSGAVKDAVSNELLQAYEDERESPDFTADYGEGIYLERSRDHGAVLYEAWGVARSDVEGRREVIRDNLRFYGAPHVAFLFMPALGDGVRTAGDIGMYAQTFLLSLTARGFHGVPQTILGMYADEVRKALGVSNDLKLLFGISFGYADPAAPVNDIRMHRLPLSRSVVIHGRA